MIQRVVRNAPRWYGVSSPEYQTYSGDDLDPPEYGRDWMPVFATSKRRARVLALRAWRRRTPVNSHRRRCFVSEVESDASPFAGMIAEPLHPCEHGRNWWKPCSDCITEADL
jgi:hypothetical protein